MNKGKSKGCCKDEHKQMKLQGEQKLTKFASPLMLTHGDVFLVQMVAYTLNAYLTPVATQPVSHAPPYKKFIPVYLSNRTFRI